MAMQEVIQKIKELFTLLETKNAELVKGLNDLDVARQDLKKQSEKQEAISRNLSARERIISKYENLEKENIALDEKRKNLNLEAQKFNSIKAKFESDKTALNDERAEFDKLNAIYSKKRLQLKEDELAFEKEKASMKSTILQELIAAQLKESGKIK